jgi:hypothetical protein
MRGYDGFGVRVSFSPLPQVQLLLHALSEAKLWLTEGDGVVFFAAIEGAAFEGLEEGPGQGAGALGFVLHVFVGLGEKAAGAAAWVVNGFARLGVNHSDHHSNDFARGEELAAVVARLTHFERRAGHHPTEVGC